jgi:hypothetical protein
MKREQNAAVFVRFAAKRCRTALLCASLSFLVSPPSFAQGSLPSATDSVSFQNGPLALGGVLYKPEGDGPFPTFLFNHGSAPGRLNDQAFEEIGPVFRDRGWVFFAPYRRGQGLSAAAGPFIGDEIAGAQRERALRVFTVVASCMVLLLALLLFATRRRRLWLRVAFAFVLIAASSAASYAAHLDAGATAMVASLETDHLDDHLAARTWLSDAREAWMDEGGEHHITIPAHNPLRVGTLAAILAEVAHHLSLNVANCWSHFSAELPWIATCAGMARGVTPANVGARG